MTMAIKQAKKPKIEQAIRKLVDYSVSCLKI